MYPQVYFNQFVWGHWTFDRSSWGRKFNKNPRAPTMCCEPWRKHWNDIYPLLVRFQIRELIKIVCNVFECAATLMCGNVPPSVLQSVRLRPLDIRQVTMTEEIQEEPKSPNNKRRAMRETLKCSVKGGTQKSTLVIVNPKSGIQKAQQIFEKVS